MREIQCKRCVFFTPEWCPKKRDSLDPDLIRDCQYFRTKTNADRIRAMSDEELAERFADACCRDYPCEDKYRMPDGMNCYGCWLDWLKAEVKE